MKNSRSLRGCRLHSALCLGLAALLMVHLPSCGDRVQVFEALSSAPENGELARNEGIVVAFSEELDPEAALASLVELKDEHGRDVPFSPRISGKSLVLKPLGRMSWPRVSTLDLKVRPGLALTLRSVDGRPLAREFQRTFRLSLRFRDYGEPMTIKSIEQPSEGAFGHGSAFRVLFSLPVDPTCLADAVSVVGDDVDFGPCAMHLEDEGRRLIVTPHATNDPLLPNRAHEVVIASEKIKALTGKTLEGGDRRLSFWSSPTGDREGVLDFSFDLNALPEWRDRVTDDAYAQPILEPLNSVTFHRKYTNLARVKETISSPVPFSSRPSRFQLLLSGEILGREPGLITGIAWFCRDLPEDRVVFPRMLIRIGSASKEVVAIGLSEVFDSNFKEDVNAIEAGSAITVPRGAEEGQWLPDAENWRRIFADNRQGWLELRFERPFFYDGDQGDLVLEISNEVGCFPADPGVEGRTAIPDLQWAGGTAPREKRMNSLVGRPGLPTGTPKKSVFATKIRIERYEEFETDWMEVPAESPEFFVLPTPDFLDADGVQGVDFSFSFQGKREDGSLSPWGRLESLAGCRNIRARLKFLPRVGRYAGRPPEVRRLRVRYRDKKIR